MFMKTPGLTLHNAAMTAFVSAMMGCVLYAAAVGTVNGSVTHAGASVAGAKVVIDSSSDATYEATTYTDAGGMFSLIDAPAGEIHVNVYDEQGVFLVSATTMLADDQVATVALEVADADGGQ
jgi:hypothetical protein